MSDLAGWTGAGIGEGVTTTALNMRDAPSTSAVIIKTQAQNTVLLLWYVKDGWYWCSDLACKIFGWSAAEYIRRTL